MLLEQREAEAIYPGKVLPCLWLADAGLILAEGHVQTPMPAVLDRPVTANGAGETLHTDRQAADVEPRLAGLLAVAPADQRRHADRPQPLPRLGAAQRFRHRHLNIAAALFPAMPRIDLPVATGRHIGKVVVQVLIDMVDDGLTKVSWFPFKARTQSAPLSTICSAIAFCAPNASMVMIAPSISTGRSS